MFSSSFSSAAVVANGETRRDVDGDVDGDGDGGGAGANRNADSPRVDGDD